MQIHVDGRRAIEVFRAGGRGYTVGDVLAASPAPAALPETALDVDDAALEAAVVEYRYARDLVSAEECDTWLARRGLVYADLLAHLRRRLAGARGADSEAALVDALLDPAFDGHARALARQVALTCEHGAQGAQTWLQTPPDAADCRRELERESAAWTVLAGVLVEFDTAAAAREARACVEADGEDLVELARAQGFAWREFRAEAGSLPAPVAQALAHAAIGTLQSAHLADGRHCLLRLASREAPRLDDPQVAARIQAALRARALDALVCRHVHWMLSNG